MKQIKNAFFMIHHRSFKQFEKLNKFIIIIVAIANYKKKFSNIFIELYVQMKNKEKKKIIILNNKT